MDKYFYNEASAAKLGWDPTWFDCTKFNDDLIESIERYQKSKGLTDDGLCGPGTYRRIYTDRQESIEEFRPNTNNNK